MKNKKIFRLTVSLLLPQLAGGIGALFTFKAISSWYQFLSKPSFSPPNWLFGPAWTILYILMGISSFLIWQEKEKNEKAGKILKIYFLHLFLNATWSIFFFGLKNILFGFLEIILLWLVIGYLLISFYKIKKIAAVLWLPYFLWVSFAMILNFTILKLN